MKLTKYLSHVLMIKRYVLDDEIHMLAYFHRDSVTNCRDSKKNLIKKILI